MVPLKTFSLCYLVVCAVAMPKIPLSKRNDILASMKRDGVLDNINRLKMQIARTKKKIQTGLAAIEKNTGNAHPALTGIQGVFTATTKHPAPEKLTPISKRATGAEPLTNFRDDLWLGSITVGTPPKTFTGETTVLAFWKNAVVIRSSLLWDVMPPAMAIHYTIPVLVCLSSTAVNTTQHFVLPREGNVTGFIFTDIVTVAGLTTSLKQALGASNHYPVEFEAGNFRPDGVVGLAFESLSSFVHEPLFATLLIEGVVEDPIFSIKLADTGSELFLGGVDSALFTGEFRTVTCNEGNFWGIPLQALDVNNETVVTTNGITAVLDTGSTVVIGDDEGVQMLYSAIPGPGFFTVPCDMVPTVGLTLVNGTLPPDQRRAQQPEASTDNPPFKIAPEVFNLGVLQGNDCVGGVVSMDGISFWVLGDVFLRNFYTYYDSGKIQVGFATPR
ncbi:aspartic peptidase domain-containing protein [Mycena vulgaris]|nr:aspartic peptidase domain-containing protein [Mycena vulgaris]